MLALRGEFDVADQHEVVVAGGSPKVRSAPPTGTDDSLIELVEGLDHPARRIDQALAAGVLADIARAKSRPPLGLGARRTRLVGADGGGQKFGRIELGGAGFRRFGVEGLPGEGV